MRVRIRSFGLFMGQNVWNWSSSSKIALNLIFKKENQRNSRWRSFYYRCCCCCHCLLFRFECCHLCVYTFTVEIVCCHWMNADSPFHTCILHTTVYIFGTRPNFQLYLLCGRKISLYGFLNRSHSQFLLSLYFHLPHYFGNIWFVHRWHIHNRAYTLETKSL